MGLDFELNQITFRMVAHDSSASCCGWEFSSFPGSSNSYEGELAALSFSMKCALFKNWKRVIFEGDNKSAILDVLEALKGNSVPSLPILQEIILFCEAFDMISFAWVPRPLNSVAHNIVKRINAPPPNLRLYYLV